VAVTYIDALPISPAQKEQIRSLGADTPAALYAMIQAEPDAFRSFLGSDAMGRIAASLDQSLDFEQKTALSRPTPYFSLGADLSGPPKLLPPRFDIEKRDRLFDELQQLKSRAGTKDNARIASLESQLEVLLRQ
jgi:hypothetical protein